MQSPPTEPGAQLQWLLDRACIGDLLVEYARCVDERDFEGLADTFDDEGVLELPFASKPKVELAATSAEDLGRFFATHHISTNHAIEVDRDRARARAYLQAVHVPDGSEPARHGDVGGWYDCELRRTEAGWRFQRVRLTALWTLGEDFPWS
jgi:hypothetical protein